MNFPWSIFLDFISSDTVQLSILQGRDDAARGKSFPTEWDVSDMREPKIDIP